MTDKNTPIIYAREAKTQFVMDYTEYLQRWMKNGSKGNKPTHADYLKQCLDAYKRELKRFRPQR